MIRKINCNSPRAEKKEKRYHIIFLLLVAGLLLAIIPVSAQSLKANIQSLDFMQGKWKTDHQWGYMEEYWGSPIGDNMISCFRCVKDGKVIFYEFVVIEQSDSVPVMLLRHFNKGSIGWEEKDGPQPYPLVRLEKNKAVFRSNHEEVTLTYERTGVSQLDVTLEEKNKAGQWEKTVFHFTAAGR